MRPLAICALVTFATAPAAADGVGVIASDGQVAKAVADALAGRAPRIVPNAPLEARAALAAGAVPIETLARFRRVRDLVDEGWRAYLRVSVDTAAVRLSTARIEAEPLLALPGGVELYADAALRHGAVLAHLGRTAESRAAYALALALDPDRPITLAEFSPDVVEAVDAVRAAPAPLQHVRIVASSAMQLVIDGRDAGRTPADVALSRGEHLIVARSTGMPPAVQRVVIDDATQIQAPLTSPDPDAPWVPDWPRALSDADAQRLVDNVLRYADLDDVILAVATTRRGGPTLLVQRCAGLPARCTDVVEIGHGDRAALAGAARAAVDATRTAELRYPPNVLGERDAGRIVDGDARCRLCRNPWVWTGVGAAVLTGVVITLVATSGSKPPPIVGVDPSQF